MSKLTALFKRIYQDKEKQAQEITRFFPSFVTPNLLSFLRLVLLLPLILLIQNQRFGLAAFLFLFAYFLDVLDGALARRKKQVTAFGKLFDPLVDKVVFLTVMFLLAKDRISDFLLYLILSLELLMVFLAIIYRPLSYFLKLEAKMGANVFGKIKMLFQTLGTIILFFVSPINQNLLIPAIIFWLAAFFSALSILKHLLSIRKIKR